MAARRIDPVEARRDVASGKALLVCAYEDEEKCRRYGVAGALSFTEWQAQAAASPRDREVVFYCA
jgi:hypothetical protein